MSYKKFFLFYFFCIFVFFSFVLLDVFCVCSSLPEKVVVFQDSKIVADFSKEDILSSKSIFINSNLETLEKVNFYFNFSEQKCFDGLSDFKFFLFENGVFKNPSLITNLSGLYVVSFDYDLSSRVDNFSSKFLLDSSYNLDKDQIKLNFKTDSQNPSILVLEKFPTSFVKPNQNAKFKLKVTDSESGIENVKILGLVNQEFNLDGELDFEKNFNFTLMQSGVVEVLVKDRTENLNKINLSFDVDSSFPNIVEFENTGYLAQNSNRYVSFKLVVEDDSFRNGFSKDFVLANFSKFSSYGVLNPNNCYLLVNYDSRYICKWDRIVIDKIDKTLNADIDVFIKDGVDNQLNKTYQKEIFFDSSAPEIKEFYLKNSIGEKNIFNAYDDNVSVHLFFSDKSMLEDGDVRIITDFDDIDFFIGPKLVEKNGDVFHYVWELRNSLERYSGSSLKKIDFNIELIDSYYNKNFKQINITIDNLKPKIDRIYFLETQSIKNKILDSHEKVNFFVYFNDSNIDFGLKDLFTADFRYVSLDNVIAKGSCSRANENFSKCEFLDVELKNGYFKKNISFCVTDIAANTNCDLLEIEVFAKSNETPESFYIKDIQILNVLNRDLILKKNLDAYFKGKIDFLEGLENNMSIINYNLKSCNDSNLNPILIGERDLYPNSKVEIDDEGKIDENFALRVEVRPHNNLNDLKTKNLECVMSILKRDLTKVYPPEFVKFNLTFDFYSMPYSNLISQNAKSILKDIEEVNRIGSWFDSVYGVYFSFKSVCEQINLATSILSSTAIVIQATQKAFSAFPVVADSLGSANKATGGVANTLGGLAQGVGPIGIMCKFVTCEFDWGLNKYLNGIYDKMSINICGEEN